MHIRNIFHPNNSGPPNFEALSKEYPALKPYLINYNNKKDKRKAGFNFKDAKGIRELTYALLKKYFKLNVSFPLENLCPIVPNRLNYIHCIEDLLNIPKDSSISIRGLDIGTGASCIYPLLVSRLHSKWHMTGTDIDEKSIDNAKSNVEVNNLSSNISLVLVKEEYGYKIFTPTIFKYNKKENEIKDELNFNLEGIDHTYIYENIRYAFTMCNPPFYENQEEINKLEQAKSKSASGICTGSNNEMITEGGEVEFISSMVKESLKYKNSVGWFTTMIGKKSTLNIIKKVLKDNDIIMFITNSLIQGNTTRWVISWTFFSVLFNSISVKSEFKTILKRKEGAGMDTEENRYLKKSIKLNTEIELESNLDNSIDRVKKIFDELDIEYAVYTSDEKKDVYITGKVNFPTWTRKWRRSISQKQNTDKLPANLQASPFEFKCIFKGENQTSYIVHITLLKHSELGLERFESWCNHLRTQLTNTK